MKDLTGGKDLNGFGKKDKKDTKNASSSETCQRNDAIEASIDKNIPPTKVPLHSWKILVILSCIATMVMYAETMLIPAIPTLIDDFDVSYGLSSWILTSYLIAGAVMTPIVGKLSDLYGRKRILLIIMVLYTIGVSMGGFANDIVTLIVARIIQGFGMSMFPIAFSIIRDYFPREKISIAQGAITSMFATGSVIGLSVGGIIIQSFGWKMTFFSIIPISLVILFMIRRYIDNDNDNDFVKDDKERIVDISKKKSRFIPLKLMNISIFRIFKQHGKENQQLQKQKKQSMKEKTSKIKQIDIKGSILLAITISSFLLSLTLMQSNETGLASRLETTASANTYLSNGGIDNNTNINDQSIYDAGNQYSYTTVLPFVMVGIGSTILFVFNERKVKYPLVDFKVFLKPEILISSIIIMFVGMSMFLVFQTIPILIQNPQPVGFGHDAIATGKVQLPFAIILLIFGPISGFVISKLGSIKPIILGSVLTSLSFVILLFFHSYEIIISTGLALLSVGLSLAAVGAMNIIILTSPREVSGVTIGMSSMLRIIGSSIGPALAAMYMQTNQSVFSIGGGIIESLPSYYAFDLIFITALLFSLVSIGLSLFLRKKIKIQV